MMDRDTGRRAGFERTVVRRMGFPAVLLALVALALAAGSCGDRGQDSQDVGTNGAPLTASQACTALTNLLTTHGLQTVECNNALAEQHRSLMRQCAGSNPEAYKLEVDQQLGANPSLAASLTAAQVVAWKALHEQSRGKLVATWDSAKGSPGFVDVGLHLTGAEPVAARADLMARVGTDLETLFGFSTADTLALRDDRGFQTGGGASLADVHVWDYGREHGGLPVFGDRYSLTIRTSDRCPGLWKAFVSASWTRDLGAVQPQPLITFQQAEAAAQASGEVPGGVTLEPPTLGFDTIVSPPQLVYQVRLGGNSASWLYHVAATTGAIVAKADQVAHSYGTLQAHVGRPHEGSTKTPRPVPWATVYEDTASETVQVTCNLNNTMTQSNGDDGQILGSTSYQGTYSLDPIYEPGDTLWAIDYRGIFVRDATEVSTASLEFYAGGTDTWPYSNYMLTGRRGEIFYLLNYGAEEYRYKGIAQFTPITYNFYEAWGPGCQDPNNLFCCVGLASGSATHACLTIDCSGDMHTLPLAEIAERRFRQVVLHEQNHGLRWRAAGSLCPWNTECVSWEEGRADFGAVSLTRAEGARPEYEPSRLYPDEYADCPNLGCAYQSGSIWTALYTHFLLHVGAAHGIGTVNSTVGMPTPTTVMVGTCLDQDFDGCIEAHECPSNTFYSHLLDQDTARYRASAQDRHTISEVFDWHVTDPVPWADELPARLEAPPFAALEFGSQIGVTEGTDPASGPLRFGNSDDHDTVMFLGRAGESYFIETLNLAQGVDTYLEVLDTPSPDGGETVLAQNDNCGGPPNYRSCVTFAPTQTAMYRVRVRATGGSQYDCDKTYQLWMTMQGDDYGDGLDEAAGLVADDNPRTASLDTTTDVDVFRVVSSAAQVLRYRACSNSMKTTVKLYDVGGVLLNTKSFNSCNPPPTTYNVGPGVYYLEVSSPGTAGNYEVQALLTTDIDINSTAANAWKIGGQGYLVGGRFETGSDAEDWYYFTATAPGDWFVVETFGLGSGVNTVLELYAPPETLYGRTGTADSLPDTSGGNGRGHWMLRSDMGALFGNGSRIAFMAPVAGNYYVRVINAWASAGPYHLVFEDVGPVQWSGWQPYP